MDDLFDVFDDKPQGPKPEPPRRQKSKKDKSKKRNANGDVKKPTDNQEDDTEMGDPEAPAAQNGDMYKAVEKKETKRRRRDEPEPVVTDSFQTAQSREVAASVGLQGSTEAGALVLQHNIQHQVSLPPNYDYVPISQHKSPEKPARTWPFE